MEEQVEMVGRAFVDHYYHLFDNDRAALSSLYQPTSMLTFEGQKIVEPEFESLSPTSCKIKGEEEDENGQLSY
ncbi:nuclear transport factor 2b [Quercus suber]|uniref:Nuclear transport factor 2b n=1 Tax=Quercus suber TaxID=58331 RepID=A0AAW0JJM0_QUESU